MVVPFGVQVQFVVTVAPGDEGRTLGNLKAGIVHLQTSKPPIELDAAAVASTPPRPATADIVSFVPHVPKPPVQAATKKTSRCSLL